MVRTAENTASEEQLKELLLHEERKSERYANYVRLLLTFLYFAVAFSIRGELPAHSFNAIILASLINLCYGIFVYFKLQSANPPNWIKYPSVSIDILLLSIVIYSFGTYRTFKTEAFLLYYLWIGLSTLRFSPMLTLASGLLSIGAYLGIIGLALHGQSIELGTITEGFVSERVSSVNIVLKLVFLSAFVVLSVYIAMVFRVIASKALTKQLLQVRNDELNTTLDKLRETQKQLAQKKPRPGHALRNRCPHPALQPTQDRSDHRGASHGDHPPLFSPRHDAARYRPLQALQRPLWAPGGR